MITNVYYKPSYLQGAYNPIIWSVLSDRTTNIDFKYVFDIYKDGTFIVRLKQRPNPQGVGMIDISAIAQGYLLVNEPNSPILQGETTIQSFNNELYSDNGTLSAHFNVKVGEEYTVAGVTQIYNGVTDVAGEPAYILNSNSAQVSDLPIHVWPSSVPSTIQQFAMSTKTQDSGAYGYMPLTGKNYDHGLAPFFLAYPLSHAPLEQQVYQFDKGVLSYINWSALPASYNDKPIFGFRFTWYDPDGTLAQTADFPLESLYGYDQRTNCADTITDQLDPQFDIVHVLMSPDDVAYVMGEWGYSYTIQPGSVLEIQGFNMDSEGVCVFGQPITQASRFEILEYCEPALYPRVRLSWLNDLGGRDYLNFTKMTEKTITATQSSYYQEQMNWTGFTPVETSVFFPTRNLQISGGEKTYNKSLRTSYRITTDWLTQDYVNLVEGLVASPQVVAYIKTDGNPLYVDTTPYAVKIKQLNWTSKNVRQNKLVQAEFEMELIHVQKIQNT